MKRLTYISENINTWNNRIFENISLFNSECSSCSAFDNFSLINKHTIWCWEVHIPFDWKYGQWERIRLYPAEVHILVVKCKTCAEKFGVYPSFVVEGTTLTQSALIFTAFAYESSSLTWRDLPEKFCDGNNKIAHSSLYKAVHGLGKSIMESNGRARKELQALLDEYLSAAKESGSSWPLAKSLYEHTINREKAIRKTLFPLVCRYLDSFTSFFYRYLKQLRTVLSFLSPPVYIIYQKQRQ